MKVYKQTPYGHQINTDTSLLRTVCFVPGKESPYIFSQFHTLDKRHHVNSDMFYGRLSVRINGLYVLVLGVDYFENWLAKDAKVEIIFKGIFLTHFINHTALTTSISKTVKKALGCSLSYRY